MDNRNEKPNKQVIDKYLTEIMCIKENIDKLQKVNKNDLSYSELYFELLKLKLTIKDIGEHLGMVVRLK